MTADILRKAMDDVSAAHEKLGIQVKGGKKYTQIANRMEAFRRHFGLEYGFETSLNPTAKGVVFTATIKNKDGFIISMGNAYATDISKEKSLEKLETTAVGRALAGIGLGGGEYASQEEVDTWPDRYEEPKQPEPVQFTRDGSMTQRDISYAIQCCVDPVEIDTVLDQYAQKIAGLPEMTQGMLGDIADNRKAALAANVILPLAKYTFIDVQEAKDFAKTVKDYVDKSTDEKTLSTWMLGNDHKLKALDVTLEADTHQTKDGSPYQRAVKLYTNKLNQLKKETKNG